MATPPISAFLLELPKAELHLHLEGSVDPATLAELSQRNNTPLDAPNSRYGASPESGREMSEGEARALYSYQNFTGFLLAFKAVTERLRTADDYELVTYRLMERLRNESVLHAEVFVSVGVVHWRGEEFAPLFEGMERGRERGARDFGVSLLWIFDAVRHFLAEPAGKVLDEAIRFRERNVVGFGIGGDERRAGPELFHDVYRRARDNGLRVTAHAGETVGPESIWGALNLGAERLGHALHAAEDSELVEVLAQRQVPVEACITSNLRTGCCTKLAEHPVRRLFDAGVMVTLNSDDPAMFSTSLAREYALAQQAFGFSDEHMRELARNSFEASFLPAEEKLRYLHLVDSFRAA